MNTKQYDELHSYIVNIKDAKLAMQYADTAQARQWDNERINVNLQKVKVLLDQLDDYGVEYALDLLDKNNIKYTYTR